jgi:hypothetical protein
MTCATFENDLALHVVRDLMDVDALDGHLRECAGCRGFLEDLRASQSLVKDLAAEAIDPEALAEVRARVVAASRSASPLVWRGPSPRRAVWAAAAAVLVAVGTLWVSVSSWLAPEREKTVAAVPVMGIAPPTSVPAISEADGARRSTPRAVPRVSPHMGRASIARTPIDQPVAAPGLSGDDADQLARAVVAMSRVRSVESAEPDGEPSPEPTPSIRLATANPDVVIYWRLDSNGGR